MCQATPGFIGSSSDQQVDPNRKPNIELDRDLPGPDPTDIRATINKKLN